jgi:hypothetical protein
MSCFHGCSYAFHPCFFWKSSFSSFPWYPLHSLLNKELGGGGHCLFDTVFSLFLGTEHLVTIKQEAGWAPQPHWIFWRTDRFLASVTKWTLNRPSCSLVTLWTSLFWHLVKTEVFGLWAWKVYRSINFQIVVLTSFSFSCRSVLCTHRCCGGGIAVFPVIADVYTEDILETVEQTACRFLCQFCYVDNILLVKMQHVADYLSGFHCNIAAMTENEWAPATFSSLTL